MVEVAFGGYRVLQCYTAKPAYIKQRSRVLHSQNPCWPDGWV